MKPYKITYRPEIRKLIVYYHAAYHAAEPHDAGAEEIRAAICRDLPFLQQVEVHIDVRDEARIDAIRAELASSASSDDAPRVSRRKRRTKLILDGDVICGGKIRLSATDIERLTSDTQQSFVAELTDFSVRELKGKMQALFSMSLASQTAGVNAKLFLEEFEDAQQLEKHLSIGSMLHVEGRLKYDDFAKENIFEVHKLCSAPQPPIRQDAAEEKRIELHAHTKMSEQDALMSAGELVNRAIAWGHSAVAITDHGSVQAFIEARDAAKGKIKVLYGVEANMVNDIDSIIDSRLADTALNDAFVVFDIETTGFSAINDELIEIGCVKIAGGSVVEEFSTLIKPPHPVSPETTELTGIDNAMLAGAPTLEEAFPRFLDFIGDLPLVAHNADFDTSFMRVLFPRFGRTFQTPYINTIALARQLLEIKRYNLKAVSNHLGIVQTDRHRALADAMATAQITLRFFQMLRDAGCVTLGDARRYLAENVIPSNLEEYHAVIFVRRQDALVDLYTDISSSYIDHFNVKPKMRKSDIARHREGYLIGSSGEHGELFQAALMRKSDEELDRIARFYDYIELLPASALSNLIASGWVNSLEQIRDINRRILESADRCGKLAVATSDAHFLDPDDEILRSILLDGKKQFDRMENPAPLYLRTTDEMLEEFSYLGPERAHQLVIENTQAIAALIDTIQPMLEGTFPTTMEGADEELKSLCYSRAAQLYGDPLPEIIAARIERELGSIIGNGYAPMYMISKKMVEQSNRDGYSVGSRGSVGSSIAAFLTGISEVNPMPPHYYCPECRHSEFFEGNERCGIDLADATCPRCGAQYKKDGFEIPFEAFLGFDGDKEPDIDLNFASVYQSTAQKYCEELFGTGYTFKAGTIGTLAEKNALGYVLKYFENIGQPIHFAHALRYRNRLMGVKKNSGQHPAGILVLPQGMDINQFTPIQYAQNDKTTGIVTTHFDYPMLSGKLLKLDVLGHESPTALRMLQDYSGVDPYEIPLDDPATMSIFSSVDSLNYRGHAPMVRVGTLGVPEFGTPFVLGMLEVTLPKTFTDLVRISGLSHGTNVWRHNAQDLVASGQVPFSEVIATREDIMNKLINKGCEKLTAFKIMESVRKGKGLNDAWLEEMNRLEMPEWYIDSCLKISYLFPKAHAAAYVTQSFKIAYYKVHHPVSFYATWFSLHVGDFDAPSIIAGRDAVEAKIRQIQSDPDSSKKDEDILYNLQIAYEMLCRGIEVLPIDLERSEASAFRIIDGKLLPPIQSLPGVGEKAARAIYEARVAHGEFKSVEEFKDLTGCNKKVIEALTELGALKHLPATNQLSFF